MRLYRIEDGRRRFEWQGDSLIQRSVLDPGVEWTLSLVKDSVNPAHPEYNEKAARAKLMSNNVRTQKWGSDVATEDLAHQDEEIERYTCHTSWMTSCAGCHLPIEANWKTDRLHYEGGETRNYATYNPQLARDQMFMLGRRGPQFEAEGMFPELGFYDCRACHRSMKTAAAPVRQPADLMPSSPTCKNGFLPNACADGNYLDYISAEQAVMAVQMLVIELDNPYFEDQLDRIADTLNNDERYRPSQFAAMLAALAEPEPEAEDIDEQDE